MAVCFPGVGLHRSRTWPGPWAAPAERTEAPPGGPYQYYAVHQYSIVRRVWGASGVAGFLIFAPPTPPQDLIAGILSTHVRCRAHRGGPRFASPGPGCFKEGQLAVHSGASQLEENNQHSWNSTSRFVVHRGTGVNRASSRKQDTRDEGVNAGRSRERRG